MLLQAINLFAGYGRHQVLHNINLTVAKGDFLGVLGPNGSGKTTLLRALTGIIKPFSGRVLLEENPLEEILPRAFARKVAVVSQSPPAALDLPVKDIVMLGRIPHFRRWQWLASERDRESVNWALKVTGTKTIAEENFLNLSGGEQQRVLIALALAQRPELLLLDEPTLHLDINFQVEVFKLLNKMNREHGLTVLSVLHDLNLASAYCRQLILIKDGRIWKAGGSRALLTEENIREVFRAEMGVLANPLTGVPVVFPSYVPFGVDP